MKIIKTKIKDKPYEFFQKIVNEYDNCFLLESYQEPKRLAKYSFIGVKPAFIVKAKNGLCSIYDEYGDLLEEYENKDPFKIVENMIPKVKIKAKGLRLAGGAVGYISYDAVRYLEKLPELTKDDLNYPDLEFGIYNEVLIYDHHSGNNYLVTLLKNPEFPFKPEKNFSEKDFKAKLNGVSINKKSFEKAVYKAKEYIKQGEVFQVVLSKRYYLNYQGDLIKFYKALRSLNPSPYMYFIKFKDRKIIGSSPELLIRVENGRVETYPIAGTRPRGNTIEDDERLKKDLLLDEKERAEHIMLVDLARNDISKVSVGGSVKVPEFMKVEKYSHVQHIVSRVVGKLKFGVSLSDVIKAVFPAGTVSGAPKPRAMEIIEELEPVRRGPYAGAVGYFSTTKSCDFAITIRSGFTVGNSLCLQAGAGIVYDSIPMREWFETEHKLKALFKALEKAEKNE